MGRKHTAVSLLLLGGLAAACGSEPGAPDALPSQSGSSSTQVAIDRDFRRGLEAAAVVADACKTDRSDACMHAALEDWQRADAGLAPQDWRSSIKWIRNLGHDALCSAMSFVPGNFTAYYLIGLSGTAGVGLVGTVGGEMVWELGSHQAAAFAYAGAGAGNIGGFSVSAYQGFAVSGHQGSLIDNWSGWFVSGGAGIAIPETTIGVSVTNFRSANLDPLGVVGATAAVSAGLDAFNPGVVVQGGGSYYIPFDVVTKSMVGFTGDLRGTTNKNYVQFKSVNPLPGVSLSPGQSEAVNILFYSASSGGFLAAAAAVGIGLLQDSHFSLASYCGQASIGCNGGGGLATAACSAAAEFPPPEAGFLPPSIEAPSCSTGDSCADGEVCSSNGTGGSCCRPTFDVASASPCYADSDCASGQVCALGAKVAGSTVQYTCIDQTAHPCSKANR